MPFLGVLPERQYIFLPSPKSDIAVNDANAWRLHQQHRHIYNKLHVALSQGLNAAPSGVSPLSMGMVKTDRCFVKPITNLGGMSLNSFATTAGEIASSSINEARNTTTNCAAGSFWCEFLTGPQTSSDILILDGTPVWYAHTRAADLKNKNRPIYWEIGADCHESEPIIETFIRRELAGYTGLCNVEMIGSNIIEAHLRGSNAFFDYYSDGFISAWVKLVDEQTWGGLVPIEQGCLYSIFSEQPMIEDAESQCLALGGRLYRDGLMHDRQGIVFCDSPTIGAEIEQVLLKQHR